MPTRAYAVPIRNDLSDSLVQFNDVFPNTSQTTSLTPVGQTGYINPGFFVTNPTAGQPPVYELPLAFGIPTVVGGAITNTSYVDGLAAWALDNLCGFNAGADNGKALTTSQAVSFASRVVFRAVTGLSLTAADLCAVMVAVSGLGGGPATTSYAASLTAGGGGQIGASGGAQKTTAQMVEEVIKILSGQVYRMLNGAVVNDNAGPDMYTGVVHNPATDDGLITGVASSGFLTAPNTNTTAAQAFPASLDFVPFRTYYYGSEILASSQEGQLAQFATHQLGANSFYFEAAKLSDGQTAATYGTGNGTGTVLSGSARALQKAIVVTGVGANNPAQVSCASVHGFKVNDVIRLRNCVQAGTIVTNGLYAVQADNVGGDYTKFTLKTTGGVNVNNTGGGSGVGTGGTVSLDSTTANVIDIPSSGTTAYQFRAIVVYDNEGNVLSV